MSVQESDLLELEKREAIGAFGLTLLNCCLPVFLLCWGLLMYSLMASR